MAEQLDPELVREVMGRVYASADAIAVRLGGRVDKRMGDAVLMVFGDPVAHEDDAERAVRAACLFTSSHQLMAIARRGVSELSTWVLKRP